MGRPSIKCKLLLWKNAFWVPNDQREFEGGGLCDLGEDRGKGRWGPGQMCGKKKEALPNLQPCSPKPAKRSRRGAFPTELSQGLWAVEGGDAALPLQAERKGKHLFSQKNGTAAVNGGRRGVFSKSRTLSTSTGEHSHVRETAMELADSGQRKPAVPLPNRTALDMHAVSLILLKWEQAPSPERS